MFNDNWMISKSKKFFGKIIVQYNICKTGKMKLKKKTDPQNIKASKEFLLCNFIFFFFLIPPLKGEWYLALFLEIFSIINKTRININRKKDSWLAKARSSKESQEL